MATVTLQVTENCSRWTTWLVLENGTARGLVMKHKDTRTCTYPYQAKGLVPAGQLVPNPVIGNFFKADGGKKAAIAAVLAQ